MARSRRACPERSRRNLEGAYLTHAARTFSTTEVRIWRTSHGLALGSQNKCLPPEDPVLGLRRPKPRTAWQDKAPSRFLRLRAIKRVSRDKSVTRFAQSL